MYYNINKIVAEELAGIDFLLKALDEADFDLPEGYLRGRITKNGMVYHLKAKNRDGSYTSRKLGDENNPEVIKYKQMRFNKQLRKILEDNKKLLLGIAGRYSSYEPDDVDNALDMIYRDSTGLVNKNPGMMSDEEWQAMPYESNIDYSFGNNPNIAYDGQEVRSKSEIILYNLVGMLGIPRHYEEDIGLLNEAGQKVYKNADLHLRDKHMKKVALEHLGRVTDTRYVENAVHKIRLYVMNGYVLNDTLLLTADNAEGKLDSYGVVGRRKARFEIEGQGGRHWARAVMFCKKSALHFAAFFGGFYDSVHDGVSEAAFFEGFHGFDGGSLRGGDHVLEFAGMHVEIKDHFGCA